MTNENNKIQEQLHYFNIQSDIDSVFGDWVVTSNGDVVNYVYPYAVFAANINEKDWLEEIVTKVWYKNNTSSNIQSAFSRAKFILEVKK